MLLLFLSRAEPQATVRRSHHAELKLRLQDNICPRTILTAGGALLDGTEVGILQGFITDDYGEHHLARIAIVMVCGIGRNMFSVKQQRKEIMILIFDAIKPSLKVGDTSVTLRGEDDDLSSF